MTQYPKRLIEVDLPIKRISAHARREKSIRHGHISTLHIWWARRPLAACRAVICASLWPDPVDDLCPQSFRDAVAEILPAFAEQVRSKRDLANLCPDTWTRWNRTIKDGWQADHPGSWADMRYALLDFIADFANWDASTVPAFLETSRALTQAAHEALGGAPGTRSLVVDPFAGGGAIPLEALRVGADAFASDLNPVAVLLNKVVLEYIPKYGNVELRMKDADGQEVVFNGLADAVRYWGNWIKEQAEAELTEFYPKDPDGATPIAYLWSRTIISEAPDDGTGIPIEVPLMRSLWLSKKEGRNTALRWVRDSDGVVQTEIVEINYADGTARTIRRPLLEIFQPAKIDEVEDGTVNRGAVTCPVTDYTTPVVSVRRQLKLRHGGSGDARLYAVVLIKPSTSGRYYRLPTNLDRLAVDTAQVELEQRNSNQAGRRSVIPNERISTNEIRRISVPVYGMETWAQLFAPRQLLALDTLIRNLHRISDYADLDSSDIGVAVQLCLALAIDKQADLTNSLCRWEPVAECPRQLFGRQAIGMVWDYAEGVLSGTSSGSWSIQVERMEYVLKSIGSDWPVGQVERASAINHPLPDDIVQAIITDPPYYDAVPYAHLSDFFYIWLKRSVSHLFPSLFQKELVEKESEIVVDRPHALSTSKKDISFYETTLSDAFRDGRRILCPNGIATVVFASKTTASWEAILQALVDAGLIITGSWPIDTEMGNRIAAQGQARLASSVHIVCRPRENEDGSLKTGDVGDWRTVLHELPGRIHAWLPRLANEGIVGADAIFACLGPALEIYSRYTRVEKASGEIVVLGEYLEHVWAAVSREALDMVFAGADTTGFEEDARLTAMWLWTLNAGEAETDSGKGFSLEYDAARKIAQGLGAHLEQLTNLVEISGSTARLLPVAQRTQYLFGQANVLEDSRPKRSSQSSLFDDLPDAEAEAFGWQPTDDVTQRVGETTLDRVHQSMLLFSAGRSEAVRRFIVDEGIGQDERFWRLANALSALYPTKSNEKRWVDGLLARKKGLGF